MPKEIRFGELVKRSGKPAIVSLWTAPEQDRPFMKAVKENRVLTVTQEPASKTRDFGRIGFHQEPHAAYFIFPKPLPTDKTQRVIGIKYDMVEQPHVPDPIKRGAVKPSSIDQKPKPERRQKRFEVIIRRTVVIETALSVSALDQNTAKREAKRVVKAEPFDATKAVIRDEVIDIRSERKGQAK
jgi:hypothetical protein